MKNLWALILGVLALILAFWCAGSKTAAPVAAVAPAAATAPAPAPAAAPVAVPASARVLVGSDGKVTLEGTVADEGLKGRLLDHARGIYGAANVSDKLAIDSKVSALKSIVLTGDVASQKIKDDTGDGVRKQVGADVMVDNQLRVVAPTAASQTAALRKFLEGKHIEFRVGSAEITPNGVKILNEVVPFLQQERSSAIEVQGHTDSDGDPNANRALSEARAKATVAYLISRGVDAKRFTARGLGADKPIAENTTPENKQRNRRIDFVLEDK